MTAVTSALAPVMVAYLALKCALGRRYDGERRVLEHLDRFLGACGDDLTPDTFARWCLTQQHLASLLAAGVPKPEPPAPVTMPATDSPGSEPSAAAVAALVARAAGPKIERKTPTTPANAEKTRAERIDRLIREARAQAEVAPAKT